VGKLNLIKFNLLNKIKAGEKMKHDQMTHAPTEMNRRLKQTQAINSNVTESILDIEHLEGKGDVPIPSLEAIYDAKDWVDNGSKL
jgi:hypothetical protein